MPRKLPSNRSNSKIKKALHIGIVQKFEKSAKRYKRKKKLAIILWKKENKEEVKKRFPNLTKRELNKKIFEVWKNEVNKTVSNKVMIRFFIKLRKIYFFRFFKGKKGMESQSK